MAPDQAEDFGFWAHGGVPAPMRAPHLHPEVELNLVHDGEAHYQLGMRPAVVPAGRLCAFWGALPHRLTACPGISLMQWVTVPLRDVLAMRLPADATRALLAGELLAGPPDPGQLALDRAQCARWAGQIRDPRWRGQVLEEVAARLRRLALAWAGERPPVTAPANLPLAARAARIIAEGYREPLRISAVAEACAVHPKYLTAAFRAACGMPPQTYLIHMRLAHAQHLLRSTAMGVAGVAFASGFGSLNAFHHAFRSQLGTTPSAWRSHGPDRHGGC